MKKLISGLLSQSQQSQKIFVSLILISFEFFSVPYAAPINKTNRYGSLIVDPLLLCDILQCRKPHKESSFIFSYNLTEYSCLLIILEAEKPEPILNCPNHDIKYPEIF